MKNAAVVAAIFTSLFTGTTTAATIYNNNDTSLELGGRAEPRFNLSKENKGDNNDGNEFKDKSRARLALKASLLLMNSSLSLVNMKLKFQIITTAL